MDQLGTRNSLGAAKLLLCAAVAAVAWWPRPGLAHAFPSQETPAVGSTLRAPPAKATITFDAPLEPLFDKLTVSNSSGMSVTAGPPTVDHNRRRLSVPLKKLAPGDYTVKWAVVAEDGHRTQGGYHFSIAPDPQ